MKPIALFCLLLCAANGFAQQAKTTLSGTVTEKISGQPLPLVNIQLLQEKDSSLLGGTVSDEKGKYELTGIAPGAYLLRYSYIGFASVLTKRITVTGSPRNLRLETVALGNEAKTLNEVTVTARPAALNASIDRKVYYADQDIMSKSGTASDILRNIPSVEVDIDGNVLLRGSGEVLILINGKPSPLMGRSRAEVLQSLPANTIERIEVITNPSARFRPDGTAGIINIILKKNSKRGTNGTLTASAGNKERYNGNFTLNLNPGKFNYTAGYSLRQDSRQRTNNYDRIFYDSTGHTSQSNFETNRAGFRPLTSIVKAGVDYAPNKQNSLGLSGSYFYRTLTRRDLQQKSTFDPLQIPVSQYERRRYDPEWEKQSNATATYEHRFKKEDQSLNAALNLSRSDEVEDNHYQTHYLLPLPATTFDNNVIRQGSRENQLTVDYSHPLGESAKLEAGYDGSLNKEDLDFYGEFYDNALQLFIKDNGRSNRFLYRESIQALYLTYQKSHEGFGYSAGIRAEQVNIRGRLHTLDSSIRNQYFKLYPTLHLSYQLSDSKELQLNYSRRINRPDADELNPFPEYRDPQNLQAGNPGLLPEIIHSAELGYKWKNKHISIVPSLYYRYKTNGFTEVIRKLNDTVLLTTSENLSRDRSAGLELVVTAKKGTLFSTNLTGTVFYNEIDASNIGFARNKSIVSFSCNMNNLFTLSGSTLLQLSGNYRSAKLTPQGRAFATVVVNAGIRQDLFKKKLTLTFTVSDLLASYRDKRELNTLLLHQLSVGRRDTRIMYLGASFRFGKTVKAPKEEKLQFDNGG